FSLSVEMLLTKELTVNELSRFDIFRTAVAGGGKGQRARAVAPEPDRHAMRLVGVAEEQAYLEHHADEHYLAGLPLVNMPPQLASGSRIFELKGQEMQAAGQGFFPGDWLVCQPVPQKQWSNLPEGHAYMVVTTDGISCRRVYRKGKKFELHAANAQYPPRALSVQDTLEVWKVGHRITTALEEAPDHLEQRIMRLEEQVRGLMALRDSTPGT
ncbi:MAG: S24 family peptidase, partial [Bacteroidota bacterium]